MHAASDIADWWDEQHRVSSNALDDMVDAHPNWFSVTVAETSMTLGAGLVDVLRLGEGVAEGGVKGYLHDGLRLLQVAPAAGKLSRFVLARVLVDAGGDICTWMSATKALRQVGVSSFATVDDLARAAGFGKVSELGGAFVDALLPALRSLGARVTALPVLRDISGVMASVRGILGAGSPTQPAGAAWAGESGFGWRTHVVSHGDWLSKLAQRYYRDMYKWPLIYAANRSLIGSNPNRIVPGQQLRIPPLPRVSAVRAAGH